MTTRRRNTRKVFLAGIILALLCGLFTVMPLKTFAANVTSLSIEGNTYDATDLAGNPGGTGWSWDNAAQELTLNGYNDAGISATGDLVINVTGSTTNTITSANKGIFVDLSLTLKGDGDLTIIAVDDGIYADDDVDIFGDGHLQITSSDDDGIFSLSGDIRISGSRSVEIQSEIVCIDAGLNAVISTSGDVILTSENGYGIYADFLDIVISGSGNLTVTASDDGFWAVDGVILSGSGDVVVNAGDRGIYAGGGDVTISGSGKVTVDAYNEAIYLDDSGTQLLLEGTGCPLTFSSEAKIAVYNGGDGNSPVGGSTLSTYNKVTGAPDTAEVIYDKTTYRLTTSVNGGHGTISAGEENIASGEIRTILFTPDKDYEIDKVTVNGIETPVKSNVLDVLMDSDKEVIVTYKYTGVPKTGDHSDWIRWIIIMLAAGAGLSGIVLLYRRKGKKN